MSHKSKFLAAASIGIAAGISLSEAPRADAAEEKIEVEKCYGINSCKGNSACGISKADIEATKSVFKKKFAKSQTHDCSGMGNCAAAKGSLEWLQVAKGSCLKIVGGFLIEDKETDGKKVKTVVTK